MTIVKVQVPIVSTSPHAGALVYAEGGKRMVEQPITPELVTKLGARLKGYFAAEWDRARQCWQIGEPVADQSW